MMWDTKSAGTAEGLHWVVMEFIWRRVVRRVETAECAALVQATDTVPVAFVAAWCGSPPPLIVAIDDSPSPLPTVLERLRNASSQPLPVSRQMAPQMFAALERGDPVWFPLESQALQDWLLYDQDQVRLRTEEMARKKQSKEDDKKRKREQAPAEGTEQGAGKKPQKKKPKGKVPPTPEQEGMEEDKEPPKPKGTAKPKAKEPQPRREPPKGKAPVRPDWHGDEEEEESSSGTSLSVEEEEEEEPRGEDDDEIEEIVAVQTKAAESRPVVGGADEPDPKALAELRRQEKREKDAARRAAAQPAEGTGSTVSDVLTEPTILQPVVPVPESLEESEEEGEPAVPKIRPTIPAWRRMGLTRPPDQSRGEALKGARLQEPAA